MPDTRFQPMEFGTCLQQMLKEKKVSASELARMMAYKSRNSIFRILEGEGGHASRKAFRDKLVTENPLGLTEEEIDKLNAALEVSRVGIDGYMNNAAIAALLSGEKRVSGQTVTLLELGLDPMMKRVMFSEALREYTTCAEVMLEISGCCCRPVFEAIRSELIEKKHDCKIRIIHYLYTGADEIISNISAIEPMLFASCYKAYGIQPGVYSPERERIYRSNSIHVHAMDRNGNVFDEVLLLTDELQFIRYGRRGPGGFALARMLFQDPRLKQTPIKAEFELSNPSQELLHYTKQWRDIEHNRPIYTVKLDMPISFIHPDLLVRAVQDGFTQTGFVPKAEIDDLIGRLYEIQLARWKNIFAKRRPTHTIFSREAMEDFARTGRQTDHYFALRPFNTQERVEILRQLRIQESNQNFSVYFFRDDVVPPNMEIALYEGVGVLLSKPFTDYDLSGDHAEAIITQEDFCRQYKNYFCEDMLKHQVLTGEETIQLLDHLIEIAQHG